MAQSLSMYRGDTATFATTVLDADTGDPVDLTGADLRFTAKRKVGDADADAVIVKTSADGIALGVGTGAVVITIEPDDTDDLTKTTTLLWDLQVTAGTVVRTSADGKLRIVADVSRTAP